MKELIAGRITQDGRPIATIMVDLVVEETLRLREEARTTRATSRPTLEAELHRLELELGRFAEAKK